MQLQGIFQSRKRFTFITLFDLVLQVPQNVFIVCRLPLIYCLYNYRVLSSQFYYFICFYLPYCLKEALDKGGQRVVLSYFKIYRVFSTRLLHYSKFILLSQLVCKVLCITTVTYTHRVSSSRATVQLVTLICFYLQYCRNDAVYKGK